MGWYETGEMNPLDQTTISALRKILSEGRQSCPPFPVIKKDVVIVTNGSILLEWPIADVDQECTQFHKLLSNLEHNLVPKDLEKVTYWRAALFPKGGELVCVEEVDRREGDDEGVLIYRHRASRIAYHWTNFELVELFLQYPKYVLFVQPKTEGVNQSIRMMAVLDQEVNHPFPVGVFANQFPRTTKRRVIEV